MTPIARTIWSQLNTRPMIPMSWGAHRLHAFPSNGVPGCRGGLTFTVQGRKFRGMVEIALMASDTYTVRLLRHRGLKTTVVEYRTDLYADQLASVIDRLVET